MNWKAWLGGLISSISTGVLTVLGAMAVLKEPPTGWQMFVIGGIPLLMSFFSYLKQTPIPGADTK